jgi:methylamine dehydrogenase light chain
MDKIVERMTRAIAQRTSRRSFLARVGKVILGAAVIPLLPIDRVVREAAGASKLPKGIEDDTSCDYWKYCAVDGYLCTCCGGGSHDCPPGASP